MAKTGASRRNGTSVQGIGVPGDVPMPRSVKASGNSLTEPEPRMM